MIRKLTLTALTALGLTAGAALASGGEGDYGHIEDHAFTFEGPFGKYDQMQLQRGLKVYVEVCSACHGLQYVPLRTLADPGGPGYTADEVRAFATENYEVFDAELDDYRPATPTDHFPAVSGDGMGPDLSLMAKARAGFHGPYGLGLNQLFKGMGGAEYIRSFLLGFTGEEDEVAGQYLYENKAFSSGWVSMPPQLEDELIDYDDGTYASAEQMAEDVSAFLMWAAEPKMMARKQTGLVAVSLLILLSVLLYLTNKKLWYPVKHGGREANL
jgi:ubiquinol-cytochrome c reductase cytochrome c1 subunit